MTEFIPSKTVAEGERAERMVVDRVTREMFVRYAGASGDFNPIHWDRDFAKSAGYEDVFGMGMFSAGVMASFLSSWLGRESVRRFRCRFVDQVWAGEQLICEGVVVRVDTESDEAADWADCELRLRNEVGTTKVTGWATCAVNALPARSTGQ